MVMPTPRSCDPTISVRRAYCVLLRPRPLNSAGVWRPNAPRSFRPCIISSGTFSNWSFLSASFFSFSKHNKINEKITCKTKTTHTYCKSCVYIYTYFEKFRCRIDKRLQVVALLFVESVRIGKDLVELERAAEQVHGERCGLDSLLFVGLGVLYFLRLGLSRSCSGRRLCVACRYQTCHGP